MTRAVAYDPFGWRLTELADPTTNPLRRVELLDDLVTCEAEELARGRRHITVVHGDPTDLTASDHLDRFYDAITTLLAAATWSRLTGGADYVTVAIAGSDRDRLLEAVVEAAHHARTAGWIVVESPHPPIG